VWYKIKVNGVVTEKAIMLDKKDVASDWKNDGREEEF
jgi:hypothetical protein